jgi:hypothetical protein
MALQTIVLATANDNAISFSIDYDDVSLLISAVHLTNTGDKGTVTIALLDRTTGVQAYTKTVAANTGTFTQNISGLNQHMVTITTRFGPGLAPPFNVSMEVVYGLGASH